MDCDGNKIVNSKFSEKDYGICCETSEYKLPLTYNESSFLGVKDPWELNTQKASMRLKLSDKERNTDKKRARVEKLLRPIKIDTIENEKESFNQLVTVQLMKCNPYWMEVDHLQNNVNIENEVEKDSWSYEKIDGVDGHEKWIAKNAETGMEIVFDTNIVVKIQLIPQDIIEKIREPPSKATISDPYYKVLSENSLQKLSFTNDVNSEQKKRPLPQLTIFEDPLIEKEERVKDAIEAAKKKYKAKEELKQKKKTHIQPDDKKKGRQIDNKNENESNKFCHDVLKPKPKRKAQFASYNNFTYEDLKKNEEKMVFYGPEVIAVKKTDQNQSVKTKEVSKKRKDESESMINSNSTYEDLKESKEKRVGRGSEEIAGIKTNSQSVKTKTKEVSKKRKDESESIINSSSTYQDLKKSKEKRKVWRAPEEIAGKKTDNQRANTKEVSKKRKEDSDSTINSNSTYEDLKKSKEKRVRRDSEEIAEKKTNSQSVKTKETSKKRKDESEIMINSNSTYQDLKKSKEKRVRRDSEEIAGKKTDSQSVNTKETSKKRKEEPESMINSNSTYEDLKKSKEKRVCRDSEEIAGKKIDKQSVNVNTKEVSKKRKDESESMINSNGLSSIKRKENEVNGFSHKFPKPKATITLGERRKEKEKVNSIMDVNGDESTKENEVNGFNHETLKSKLKATTITIGERREENEEVNSIMDENDDESTIENATRKENEKVNGFGHDVVSQSGQKSSAVFKFNPDALDYEDEDEDAELDIHPDEDDFAFVDNYLPPVVNGTRYRKLY